MSTNQPTVSQLRKRRARKMRLVYVNEFDKGIERRPRGRGFTYIGSNGKTIKSQTTLRRIEALAIPPAWQDVWIAARSNAHIQARGLDAAGRKQYIYHERWQAISMESKFDRMLLLAKLLPRIRRRVRKDLNGKKLTRERVLAAVVRLLDKGCMRVGNIRDAEEHGSRGATTLKPKHVEVNGFTISLDFPGKSGQQQEIEFSDAQTAKVIKQCEDLPGQYLFCYLDEEGELRRVDSTDVNQYLSEITEEAITAKDFRTWWGSVVALSELSDMKESLNKMQRKQAAAEAVAVAAEVLGNTKAVCRKSYIHPGILAAAESGELPDLVIKAKRGNGSRSELDAHETLFARVLPHLEFS